MDGMVNYVCLQVCIFCKSSQTVVNAIKGLGTQLCMVEYTMENDGKYFAEYVYAYMTSTLYVVVLKIDLESSSG